MRDVSKDLKAAREKAGLGLREAARQMGVSAAQLAKMESGEQQNPTRETMIKVSKVLGFKGQFWLGST